MTVATIGDLQERASRLEYVAQCAEPVVEKFSEWLRHKSDNGYFDEYELDVAWQAETLLDELHKALTDFYALP